MIIKTEPPTEQNVSVSGSGNHTDKVYHNRKESAMFEFEIILQKEISDETNLVVTGQATGCINDHLANVIKPEDGIKWMQIGNVVVPLYRIEAIKITGVSF